MNAQTPTTTAPDPPYRRRIADAVLEEVLADFPAISVVGPRASGKTTTALRYARSVVRLDRPGEAAVAAADPDALLRGLAEPVLIDEWQEAPAILGAVKRSVDADPHPGRFLLTGSVRAPLESSAWPGTGRLVQLPMTSMSLRERLGDAAAEPWIERVARSGVAELRVPAEVPDLRGYVRLAMTGGFPEPALRLPERARARWLESYLQQMVTRDAQLVEGGRDPARLRRYIDVLALNTAGLSDAKTLYVAAGVSRTTADAYERLFGELFLLDLVPAWFSNRLKRLVKSPKRYLVDTGLVVGALNVDEDTIMRDHDVIGRLLDTLVAAEIRAELPACHSRPRLHHLRTEAGRHEVDLVIELAGGRVIAIEVKANTAVSARDSRHLAWLRDELGDRFLHGLVVYTGPRVFELGDRIDAVPICALWG